MGYNRSAVQASLPPPSRVSYSRARFFLGLLRPSACYAAYRCPGQRLLLEKDDLLHCIAFWKKEVIMIIICVECFILKLLNAIIRVSIARSITFSFATQCSANHSCRD